MPARCGEFFGVVTRLQKAAIEKRFLDSAGRRLDEFSDDHSGSRGNRRSAVGDHGGVRLHDFDAIDFESQGLGGDLRKDRVGALTHLGAAREHAHSPFRSEIEGGFGSEIFLARSSKSSPVQERGKTDAAFDGVAWIFFLKAPAFGVIAAEFQSAIQEVGHVDWFADHLMDREALALVNEVAAAQFVWRDADDLRRAIEMALESEDTLRGSESAEGAVRWHVGGDGAAAYPHVGAMVRASGVDCAARKDHLGKRCVSAAVDGEVDVHGQ